MLVLLLTMIERIGILVTVAFVLTRIPFFRKMVFAGPLQTADRFKAALLFGFFGIIGTYSGVLFNASSGELDIWAFELANTEAIANSRVIGIVMGGLFGGWKVGAAAGLIAGIHRYTLGGFTAFACSLAAVVAGLMAGFFFRKSREVSVKTAFLAGFISECVQMGLILLLARPFDQSWALVEVIGIPMMIANGLGAALFLIIIKNVIQEEEKAASLHVQKSLRIARDTIPHLRNGLDASSGAVICEIVRHHVKATAVAIHANGQLIAFKGLSVPRPPVDLNGRPYVKAEANNESILAAPIWQGQEQAGILTFYFQPARKGNDLAVETLLGISSLIGNQLAQAESEQRYALAKEAEVKALQAQISPHFLFNSLNTIVSLTRIEPDKARELLLALSRFLRKNLAATTAEWISLSEEIDHVKAYLIIEETRFHEKLQVNYTIEETALLCRIPPLTLQPIVENAVKYSMKDGGRHVIDITISEKRDHVFVSVEDDGPGVGDGWLNRLGREPVPSEKGSGIALFNVNKRLQLALGSEAALSFTMSEPGGLCVSFCIPFQREKEGTDHERNSCATD